MAKVTDKYLEIARRRNPDEPLFLQTVEEVLSSIDPVVAAHPEFEETGLMERLIEPERVIMFKVTWQDDSGKVQVNRGFRIQFNGALGPYKGGLRFAPNVNLGTLKFLAFEQTFKNALTGLPIGGGKGGSDFDPKGKSDAEIMRFCQAFMTELYRHIGPETDVPAGDLGVGAREVGYLFGQYRRIRGNYDAGVLTGKALSTWGLPGRSEATGYGLVFFLQNMLKHGGDTIEGKTAVVSGYGNVAWGAIQKLDELGAKVIAFSASDGYILDEEGVTGDKIDFLLEMRAAKERGCARYAEKYPNAKFFPGKKPWEVKADFALPCAVQNEVDLEQAKLIVANGVKYYAEGANMPATNEAIAYMLEHGVNVGPAKAANAGGVACSAIEMSQNSRKLPMERAEVYRMLEGIMKNIHDSAAAASEEYGYGYNLVAGANIAGFLRVAAAMTAQGYI